MTARRKGPARPSATRWAVRGSLALAAFVAGFQSVSFSLAQVLASSDASVAHRLAPYDGRITARLAASLATSPEATRADRDRADALAREALRRDPSAVSAVSALGINTQLRGDTASARHQFAYAQTLSRRDLPTQLWAIEDAVGRGDVRAALAHYDIALRTKPAMSDLLFPVLSAASSDPAIRAQLIRRLAGKPLWGAAFIDHMALGNGDPRTAALLFLGMTRAGLSVPDSARSRATNALIAAGRTDEAWAYFAAGHPGADRRRSRDPRFRATIEIPSQFDWSLINDGTVSTSIQRDDAGSVLNFTAPPSVGGAIVQQYQLLPPGRYRLAGKGSVDDAGGLRPYWSLACKEGRELGRVALSASGEAGDVFAGVFMVPAGCPIQALTLIARPSDAVSGLSGRIEWVELVPSA